MLIDEPLQVAELARHGVFGHDSASHFVRDDDQMRVCAGLDEVIRLGQRPAFELFGIAGAMFPAEIAEPESEAIQNDGIELARGPADRGRNGSSMVVHVAGRWLRWRWIRARSSSSSARMVAR